jgi:hypothetical protein
VLVLLDLSGVDRGNDSVGLPVEVRCHRRGATTHRRPPPARWCCWTGPAAPSSPWTPPAEKWPRSGCPRSPGPT